MYRAGVIVLFAMSKAHVLSAASKSHRASLATDLRRQSAAFLRIVKSRSQSECGARRICDLLSWNDERRGKISGKNEANDEKVWRGTSVARGATEAPRVWGCPPLFSSKR
jgi:hypothetical protein